jgi:hypothetical protein
MFLCSFYSFRRVRWKEGIVISSNKMRVSLQSFVAYQYIDKARHRITTIVLIMTSCNPSCHNQGCRQFRTRVWGLYVNISNGEICYYCIINSYFHFRFILSSWLPGRAQWVMMKINTIWIPGWRDERGKSMFSRNLRRTEFIVYALLENRWFVGLNCEERNMEFNKFIASCFISAVFWKHLVPIEGLKSLLLIDIKKKR